MARDVEWMTEHLKYGGHSVVLWLHRIFNIIIQLEDIPPCLKLGATVPVFKGKGRDPTNPNNYRGITITSVISKCLEIYICKWLFPVLDDKGFPHHAQIEKASHVLMLFSPPKKPS